MILLNLKTLILKNYYKNSKVSNGTNQMENFCGELSSPHKLTSQRKKSTRSKTNDVILK